jgi:3-carboxy-cis,cis-muconate cycloisomerase
VQATGAALAAMCGVIAGLSVDPVRMRANLAATNGTVFAERVVMRAGSSLGREAAHALIGTALARSRDTGATFGESLRATPGIVALLSEEELQSLDDARQYLGAAEMLRRRLLASAETD